MSHSAHADTPLPVNDVSAAELAALLDRGERPFLLDVRHRDEFDAWRIEARGGLPALNVPYFDILELGNREDVAASAREYFARVAPDALPKHEPILTVCAKGSTSAFVAEGLRAIGLSATNLAGGMQAWAAHYSVCEVPTLASSPLSILQVARPARGCLSYIVASGGRAIVIDALRHIDRYIAVAAERGWRIETVIDTHAHADHVSGGAALAARVGASYFLHPYDAIHPVDLLAGPLVFDFLRDGMRFAIGEAVLTVLHAPGHTLGNTALRLDASAAGASHRYLFSGDTMFIRSIARPDLGGHAETWAPIHYDSLARLAALPGDTLVLPGHSSSPDEASASGLFAAPLARLLAENADLRGLAAGRETFVREVLAHIPTFPPEYIEIKRVNIGLITPDEDRTSELETGKNICGLAVTQRCASS